MIDVRYEEVVANLERQARQLIAHCGVDWEDRCLEFRQIRRAVHTASVAQVCQPIYRDSVGRSQPNRDLLRPLLDALEIDDIDLPNRSFAEELSELTAWRAP